MICTEQLRSVIMPTNNGAHSSAWDSRRLDLNAQYPATTASTE